MHPIKYSIGRPIPQELIDKIIDLVAKEEGAQAALRSFALACRAWLPRSRRRLFERIIITNGQVFERFLIFIESYPQIAAYIEAMEFLDGTRDVDGERDRPRWINDGIQRMPISVISRILRGVENLSVAHSTLSVPLLKTLIYSLPKLSTLTVGDLQWTDSCHPRRTISGHRVSGVRTLEITDVLYIGILLRCVGSSLEELRINLPDTRLHNASDTDHLMSQWTDLEDLDLGPYKNLHSLRFSHRHADDANLVTVYRFLLRVRHSKIRSIYFKIEGVDSLPIPSHGPSIDDVLRAEAFNNLEEVVVILNRSKIDQQKAKEEYGKYLSVPMKRGILQILPLH
ncbi:hypothetical protein A0H81_06802 [Grifola frondosa]|uniref:F-box domain-containing protein n=1 Tax=Grifola frondosa TaxID=5627 RepID=A0A1C7M7N7_GRIFR|nr:hypothetical protein A0H81_06802 [Grifola frondosa]